MKIKNKELHTMLVFIDGVNTKTGERIGVLYEKIDGWHRRSLQKLMRLLMPLHEQYSKDFNSCKDDQKEIEILNEEEHNIDHDGLYLPEIEAIKTAVNYDFEFLEKFAKLNTGTGGNPNDKPNE